MADRFRILEKERERKKRMIRFLFFFLAMICLISEGMWSARMYGFQTHIFSGAEEMYMPRLAYLNRSPQKTVHEFFIEQSYLFLPTAGYAMEHRREGFTAEDQETVAQILEAQANDENCIDETEILLVKSLLKRRKMCSRREKRHFLLSICLLRG